MLIDAEIFQAFPLSLRAVALNSVAVASLLRERVGLLVWSCNPGSPSSRQPFADRPAADAKAPGNVLCV